MDMIQLIHPGIPVPKQRLLAHRLRLPTHRVGSIFLLCCLLFGSAGCQAEGKAMAWTVNDLRLLDPVDASDPQADILALYTRSGGAYLELRIDLLNLPVQAGSDLEITFLSADKVVTLRLPAEGSPVISDWSFGLHVDLERNPDMDTVTVRLNRLFIPRQLSLQVKAYLSGQDLPADSTSVVSLDAPPPSGSAGVLLAFWDVFPAATPAQALRRWDGAHTGPYGRRHGLSLLLRAVEKYQVPVVLLDLLNPASLAALNFTDSALAQVQRLASAGLVTMPEAACGQPADVALSFSHEAALDFGLPDSPFVYTCGSGLQPGFIYQFIPLDDPSHLSRTEDAMLLMRVPPWKSAAGWWKRLSPPTRLTW
jgi:hypothetical protein